MMLKLAGQNPKSAAAAPQHHEEEPGTSQWNEDEYEHHDDAPGPPPGLPPGAKSGAQIAPPGPPPGRPPTMPPGPPPGLPPSMPRNMQNQNTQQVRHQSNVFSAPPSLISRPQTTNKPVQDIAPIISAKPKLTSTTKVDVTRFTPTSLRVNRQTKGRKQDKSKPTKTNFNRPQNTGKNLRTADAAYDSFMEEMQGLL